MKFKVGDKVRVTKDWAGEAKTGMVGTVRIIVDYGPDRIGVDFGENATTEMHTLEGTLMSDTGWYIPEDHLELIPREIKPGSKWRNVHREVTVHAATLESVMVGPVGETHASAFPIDFFRATHVWVSDPVKTPVTLEIGSPLVKALDELSDTHPGDEFELRHVRAVMTEWRAIKAKMGVK